MEENQKNIVEDSTENTEEKENKFSILKIVAIVVIALMIIPIVKNSITKTIEEKGDIASEIKRKVDDALTENYSLTNFEDILNRIDNKETFCLMVYDSNEIRSLDHLYFLDEVASENDVSIYYVDLANIDNKYENESYLEFKNTYYGENYDIPVFSGFKEGKNVLSVPSFMYDADNEEMSEEFKTSVKNTYQRVINLTQESEIINESEITNEEEN